MANNFSLFWDYLVLDTRSEHFLDKVTWSCQEAECGRSDNFALRLASSAAEFKITYEQSCPGRLIFESWQRYVLKFCPNYLALKIVVLNVCLLSALPWTLGLVAKPISKCQAWAGEWKEWWVPNLHNVQCLVASWPDLFCWSFVFCVNLFVCLVI